MSPGHQDDAEVDSLTLRFVGREADGSDLHELRAAHVAEVLQGVVELSSDFAKAGAFGDDLFAEVLVRPAREGSFEIEVVRAVQEFASSVGVEGSVGVPTLGAVLWWATRSMRAEVKDFSHLENGNVKVVWQDDTVQEVPREAWDELNKRKRRRKKQLRKIMAPLSDPRVEALKVAGEDSEPEEDAEDAPQAYTLTRSDYDAVRPEDDVRKRRRVFETEAQPAAVDFYSGEKWRVRTPEGTRTATVEDEAFLARVDRGLALHKTDIFVLRIREDVVKKNGRTTKTWTILEVKSHRRAAGDDS
ncbi:hypothetical protein [Aeromicrobium sp. HA]|uniref:hypothetical protein n=1 Tax=Aeromicrobium sp. HA TaxID=3009077 RepID=UPI0022AFA1BF|nr:hypothetical protein [Aeromicrobium sp. HA]